jgi:apolipoprotein D and lipocalin family protein
MALRVWGSHFTLNYSRESVPGETVMRYITGIFSGLAGGLLLAGAFAMAAAPLKTVDNVDLDRYMGRWYEIAAMPMYFQRECKANTTADYTLLSNGTVQVVNGCDTGKSKRIFATGRAKVMDKQTNAKLKVTFINFLGWRYIAGGDYWITVLAPDYSYAVVGHPARKYGWILAREPLLSRTTLQEILATLKAQGYDPCRFIAKPQPGGLNSPQSLCEITR